MLNINCVTSESDRNEKLILSVVKNGTETPAVGVKPPPPNFLPSILYISLRRLSFGAVAASFTLISHGD